MLFSRAAGSGQVHSGVATGTVEFRNGTTSTLPAANYSIRAVYGGTSNVNGSQSGTLSLRVRRP